MFTGNITHTHKKCARALFSILLFTLKPRGETMQDETLRIHIYKIQKA